MCQLFIPCRCKQLSQKLSFQCWFISQRMNHHVKSQRK
jgi:hypothetical protein